MLQLQPLTLWGAVVGLAALVVLKTVALKEMDLILSVIGSSTLCLIALGALLGGWNAFRCRKSLQCQLSLRATQLFAREPLETLVRLNNPVLFPGFRLHLRLRFEHSGVHTPSFLLTTTNNGMQLQGNIVFPHRGMWLLKCCEFRIEDVLGLTSFGWELTEQREFEVHPLPISESEFPEPQSGTSSGDFSSPSRERTGDLYDLKAYDPSDGLGRILWKQYAKSRTLMVRRPEPAVLPQNEVAVYLIAAPDEDDVASACLNYIRELELSGVTVLFGSDGISESQLPLSGVHNITIAALRAVWSKDAGSAADFRRFLQTLQGRAMPPSEVITFFGSSHGLAQDLLGTSQSAGMTFTAAPIQSVRHETAAERREAPTALLSNANDADADTRRGL